MFSLRMVQMAALGVVALGVQQQGQEGAASQPDGSITQTENGNTKCQCEDFWKGGPKADGTEDSAPMGECIDYTYNQWWNAEGKPYCCNTTENKGDCCRGECCDCKCQSIGKGIVGTFCSACCATMAFPACLIGTALTPLALIGDLFGSCVNWCRGNGCQPCGCTYCVVKSIPCKPSCEKTGDNFEYMRKNVCCQKFCCAFEEDCAYETLGWARWCTQSTGSDLGSDYNPDLDWSCCYGCDRVSKTVVWGGIFLVFAAVISILVAGMLGAFRSVDVPVLSDIESNQELGYAGLGLGIVCYWCAWRCCWLERRRERRRVTAAALEN